MRQLNLCGPLVVAIETCSGCQVIAIKNCTRKPSCCWRHAVAGNYVVMNALDIGPSNSFELRLLILNCLLLPCARTRRFYSVVIVFLCVHIMLGLQRPN